MEQAKTKWYAFLKVNKIFGIHIKYFLPIAAIVIAASFFNILPDGFIGTIAVLMAFGGILSWIGMTTPVLRHIGGYLLLPLFGAIILKKVGLIGEIASTGAKVLMDGGLQMIFVSAVVVGSILAMDRRFLISSVVRYLPVLIISQVAAIGFSMFAGWITGTNIFEAFFYIAAPCMTGGSSGAIATLPALYSAVQGTDVSSMGGTLLAVAMIGEYMAVLFVVLLKVLADRFPKLIGNGQGKLLKRESPALIEARKNAAPYEDSSLDYTQLGAGLFVSVAVMVAGVLLAKLVPQVMYIAWAIIICIIIKGTGILPDSVCKAANYWGQFAIKNILIILVTALGLSSMSASDLSSVFSVSTLLIIFITFIGAVLGAMLASKLFGLYRYEGSLTAALCACNIGASGDIQMLVLSDRIDLLAFATISTRIGGAMMLLYVSILYPLFAQATGLIH